MTWKKKDPGRWCERLGASETFDAGELDNRKHSLPTHISQARRQARAQYARDAVFEEFGYRYARALDCDGFIDRRPNEPPRPSPEAWRFAREVRYA